MSILPDMSRQRSPKYDQAVPMYQSGLSIQDVATYFQVTRQAMWDIMHRRGAKFRPNTRNGTENHFARGTKAVDRAQNILEKAVEKGIIERHLECEKCGVLNPRFKNGRTAIQAHHSDYDKPLEVMWLCQRCHHKWHKSNKAKGSN